MNLKNQHLYHIEFFIYEHDVVLFVEVLFKFRVFMKTEAFWLKLLGFLDNSMWEPAHIWFQELIIKFLELWDGW